MAKVRVFARVQAKASREQEVRTALLDLLKASRTEDGVELYELFETTDGGEFIVNEQYASPEDFEQHKSSAHFKDAVKAVESSLEEEMILWVVDPVEPVL